MVPLSFDHLSVDLSPYKPVAPGTDHKPLFATVDVFSTPQEVSIPSPFSPYTSQKNYHLCQVKGGRISHCFDAASLLLSTPHQLVGDSFLRKEQQPNTCCMFGIFNYWIQRFPVRPNPTLLHNYVAFLLCSSSRYLALLRPPPPLSPACLSEPWTESRWQTRPSGSAGRSLERRR